MDEYGFPDCMIQVPPEGYFHIYDKKFWNRASKGEWEKETFDFIKSQRGDHDVFIDLGASTGIFSLFAAKLGYEVHAYEPFLENALAFKAIILANKESNKHINVKRVAVGNYSGITPKEIASARDVITDISFTGFSKLQARKELQIVSFKDEVTFWKSLQGRKIIKFDIEGTEYSILKNRESVESLRGLKTKILLAFHPGGYRTHHFIYRNSLPILRYFTYKIFQMYNLYDAIIVWRNLKRLPCTVSTPAGRIIPNAIVFGYLLKKQHLEFIVSLG
jgi:FkbM family methyltransferase